MKQLLYYMQARILWNSAKIKSKYCTGYCIAFSHLFPLFFASLFNFPFQLKFPYHTYKNNKISNK